MQSQRRKFKRQMMGLQNDVPSSTKISKYTEASKKETRGPGYRTNRFASKPLSLKVSRVLNRILAYRAIKAELAG